MYVDQVPNLWNEVEGHSVDRLPEKDVDQSEFEGAAMSQVPKLGTEVEVHSADPFEDKVVCSEDLHSGNVGEPEKLEAEIPSRVQRIKKRRELQRINRLEREKIAELEVAVMQEEAADLKKYMNERKKRYLRTGFAKEL
ncbi:hypothetical protein ZOSMA_181G00070 [Zostera marina]|uniref:Uncharacterized protein n=1 Tax=Zostera marina TaxID=29655 RepID=A0A0K9PSZ9_ZOSMR|nr:hypothetical protein ZOSMA_181G00070 [Zostera marina]